MQEVQVGAVSTIRQHNFTHDWKYPRCAAIEGRPTEFDPDCLFKDWYNSVLCSNTPASISACDRNGLAVCRLPPRVNNYIHTSNDGLCWWRGKQWSILLAVNDRMTIQHGRRTGIGLHAEWLARRFTENQSRLTNKLLHSHTTTIARRQSTTYRRRHSQSCASATTDDAENKRCCVLCSRAGNSANQWCHHLRRRC